ncbi:hypothetical protein CsSME_00029220 [Camellia sinensis var. sinensis]
MRGGRQCNLFELDLKLFNFNWLICSIGVQNMGKCKGCGKLRSMVLRDGSVSVYPFPLMLSPVVSVCEYIVCKIKYPFRPEWV